MNHPATPAATRRPLPPAMLDALRATFGERVSIADAVRAHHGRDESPFDPQLPDAVVFAHNADEVRAVVSLCALYSVPLIPYGAGSSLEGHLLAVRGGVSLDLSEMNRVLSIDAEDLTVTVEPGITRKALNEALRDTGLFFPIDPGADASIGGMTATRASGTNAVRYGTMRENVLGLSAVLADGRVV
ncbi:2-hydroxy-acid oxidase, partial [Burkholderia ubonensis]